MRACLANFSAFSVFGSKVLGVHDAEKVALLNEHLHAPCVHRPQDSLRNDGEVHGIGLLPHGCFLEPVFHLERKAI